MFSIGTGGEIYIQSLRSTLCVIAVSQFVIGGGRASVKYAARIRITYAANEMMTAPIAMLEGFNNDL